MNRTLNDAVLNSDEKRVRELLKEGANPNEPDQFGLTPVHTASQRKNPNILLMLLENGGNPNIKAKGWSGSTPMHLAAINSNVQTLQLLLKFGGNLLTPNNRGELPLHTGSYCNDYDVISFLAKKTGNANILSKSGDSALHYATLGINNNAIAALRDNNADFNIRDKNGCTPLHNVFSSWKKADDGKVDLTTIKILLESGSNPNIGDRSNKTPLHYAARFGDGRMAKILLDFGADINARSNMKDKETPINIAKKEKNEEVMAVFREYVINKRRTSPEKASYSSPLQLISKSKPNSAKLKEIVF